MVAQLLRWLVLPLLAVFSVVAPVQLACALGDENSDAPVPGSEQALEPFLEAHCLRCHGPQEQKGELRIDTLSRDFAGGGSAMHWGDVQYRISAGEMPPDDEPQPSAEESARVVDWLSARLKEGESARLAKRERVTFQKLTRDEYANTVFDLLGVHFDATDPTGLPEDSNWNGIERIGSVLSLSPAHIEKYLAAAEAILAEAFPDKQPEKVTIRWNPWDIRGIEGRDRLEKDGLLAKVRLDVWPGSTFAGHPGSVQHVQIPVTGQYKVRVKLSGLQPPGGRAPHLTIYAADLDRMLFASDIVAPEDQPTTIEFACHLPAGTHTVRMMNDVPGPSNLPRSGRSGSRPFFSIKEGRYPWQVKLTDEVGQPIVPFLIVDWMEWEGPVFDGWPTTAQRLYALPADAPPGDAQRLLSQFAERAFRRPVNAQKLAGLNLVLEREIASGESPAAALRTAQLAVLCSQDFIYLVEGAGANGPLTAGARVDDWELAGRLSYFLWSTMPDQSLRDAAASGTLHQPDVLRAQVARLLADPQIERFTRTFAREWLQLRKVGMFPPDRNLYPDYDDYLQTSMVDESTAFFHEVLTKDGTLRDFLDSRWTMLNERLAGHYGMPNVVGSHFTRVELPAESHRGGVLTQAAVLSLTSDGTRHRPVHRGKWLLESIVGRSPPPPPANVKPIEPTPANSPKATLRMKLAAHESDAHCAACHKRIDPLGLAFDHYDAIGRWRTTEAVKDGSGDNPPIDASGELPDGRKFADAAGLKQILMDDLDKFGQAFVEKLAIFALRRAITIDDRAQIKALADQARASDYRLSAIVEQLVLSDLFRSR